MTLNEVLHEVGIMEEQYIDSLKVSHHGRSVILKCNPKDVLTNGCHHEILKLWHANIDFQSVLDEYSTIMYVCGYMMKSEKAMGELLKNVSN